MNELSSSQTDQSSPEQYLPSPDRVAEQSFFFPFSTLGIIGVLWAIDSTSQFGWLIKPLIMAASSGGDFWVAAKVAAFTMFAQAFMYVWLLNHPVKSRAAHHAILISIYILLPIIWWLARKGMVVEGPKDTFGLDNLANYVKIFTAIPGFWMGLRAANIILAPKK